MILSAAMMLEWLGIRHDQPTLRKDGSRLRGAVEKVLSDGQALTRDLGGTATTQSASEAVLDALGAS